MQRVFIAHMISGKLSRRILEAQKKFVSPLLRITPSENLHMTLVPPWYVHTSSQIIKCLNKELVGYKPFQLNFTHLFLGPNKKHPRLIWITANPSKAFENVSKKLHKALGKKEENPIILPHVTIARFIKHHKPTLSPINETLNWHEEVASVSLVASHLQSGGARYEILQTWKFM